jgi:hypothetical protein
MKEVAALPPDGFAKTDGVDFVAQNIRDNLATVPSLKDEAKLHAYLVRELQDYSAELQAELTRSRAALQTLEKIREENEVRYDEIDASYDRLSEEVSQAYGGDVPLSEIAGRIRILIADRQSATERAEKAEAALLEVERQRDEALIRVRGLEEK